MHKFTAIKQTTDFDSRALADQIGVDVVTLHMFEHGLAPIAFETAMVLCEVLDVLAEDMFPNVAEIINLGQELNAEAEMQALFFDPPNRMALLNACIDPDLRDWIMVVTLRSGIERRYRMLSQERDKMKALMAGARNSDGFFCFYADCQQVLLRKSAVSEISFVPGASYAAFSSRERSQVVTLVSEGDKRPELVGVNPDGGRDGEGPQPFAELISAANSGEPLPPFFQVEDDREEERFVSINGLEVLEIPMGVIFPDIYQENSDSRLVTMDDELATIAAQGSA